MLLIFEEVDKSGKTTLAKRLSEELSLPYIKLKNISIEDDESISKDVSIATHSQLETLTQLYEKGVIKDAILDRFHGSEFVYSKIFNRQYPTEYLADIDSRLSKFNDVLLIRTVCDYPNLVKRWEKEHLLHKNLLKPLINLYDEFYSWTKLQIIEINSTFDEELSFALLMGELYKRGIYKGHPRPRRESHEDVMMALAKVISKRGTCLNRQVGAVLVEDGYVVGLGYNGPPSGLAHCTTCLRREKNIPSGQSMELSRALHAEENAIQQSGIRNRSNKDLRIFCTDSPCISCMRKLINIGVNTIYYIKKYNDELAWQMAEEANIKMIQMDTNVKP